MRDFDDRFFETEKMTALRQTEEESLINSLAEQYGYPYVNLRGVAINPEALITITEEEALAAKAVGFELANKKLSVAIRNPNNPATQALLEKLGNDWEVQIFMCTQQSLDHAWERYQDQKQTTKVKKGVLDIDAEEIARLQKVLITREAIAAQLEEIRTLNNARRVSSTMEVMFAGALGLGASDIHIEPEPGDVRIRFRLDGVLHDIIDLDLEIYKRLMTRIKLLAGLKLNVHDEAQDGRFTFDVVEKEIEVRTSVIPGSDGESAVMRLLDPTVASFNMDELGINETMYQVMTEELKRPNGMVITTGPTGSGKTTALYAFLRRAHTPEVKIITIEDPVEYRVEDIVQTQVSDDYTFSSGLRSILRQDPDIIMVGEIRDDEVAETAVHAAQTGHLVFSTLHTNSAVGAFPRLIDIGVDYRMIGSSVNIVLAQRLVRRLCPHCKVARNASEEEKKIITKVMEGHPKPSPIPDPLTIYDPGGCSECNGTGYKGRKAVYEGIRVDDAVEEAIIRDPREHVIMEAARPQGIPTMPEDGIDQVLQGITSMEELHRVIDLTRLRGVAPKEEEKGDDDFLSHIV